MALVRSAHASILAALLAASAAACGNLSGDGDDGLGETEERPGTWGHLSSEQPSWLVQLPPDARVGVCAETGVDLVTPLAAWAEAAGRRDRLSFVLACGSDDSEAVDRQITVLDTRDDSAKKTCESLGDVGGFALVTVGVVVICIPEETVPVSLHEVGHLWGMCDVYPLETLSDDGTRAAADNCDPAWFTGRDRHSVMGANYAKELAPGDADGIRSLTSRGDVVGNKLWTTQAPLTTTSRGIVSGRRARPPSFHSGDATLAGLVDADPAVVTPDRISELLRAAEAMAGSRSGSR